MKFNIIKIFKKDNSKIRGENNNISADYAELHNVRFDIVGSNNSITIESGTKLFDTLFRLRGCNHSVLIGKGCRFNGPCTIWLADKECKLTIGDKTTIESAHIALTEPLSAITIGEDCMIANDVDIRCGDSHSIIDLETGKRINYAQDVHISNHVWVASHVQILKGVAIGENSIIAAGSVVTKNVPPNAIAAGVPANVARSNITWTRERIYENSKR